MHPLTPNGAGFKADQEMFLEIPRPTDMDVDGRGRIYVSSWRDGGFNYSKPDIGYVIRLAVKDAKPPKFPDLKAATDEQLVGDIGSDSAVLRLDAQRELLRRGLKPAAAKALETLAASKKSLARSGRRDLHAGAGARAPLDRRRCSRLAKAHPEVREFAIKALADRREDWAKVDHKAIAAYLTDPNPRVRLQAVVALGKLGHVEDAPAILPLTADSDPLVAHVAVKALVALNAGDACLKALGDSKLAPGASMALQAMHDPKVLAGLIKLVGGSKDSPGRKPALKALCRLYFAEAPYEGKWWGTRPDTSGPYYNAITWDGSDAVGQALRSAVKQSDDATSRWLLGEMLKNKVDFEDTTALAIKLSETDPTLRSSATDLLIGRPKLSLDAIKFLEKEATTDADTSARAKAIRGLAPPQRPAGGPRVGPSRAWPRSPRMRTRRPTIVGAWSDYAKDGRHARDAGTFVKLAEGPDPGKGVVGYGVLLQIDNNQKAPEGSRAEARKAIDRGWSKPETTARLLRAVALARSGGFNTQVRAALTDNRTEVRQAAEFAARRLNLTSASAATRPSNIKPIAATPFEQVLAAVLKDKGDASLGAQLFEKQGCVNCHSVTKGEAIKGPYLGDISTRYNRSELTESILKPSAKIAQGFETKKVALTSGQVFEGFVVREAGDEIEMRNSAGAVTIIPKKDIEETGKSELSVMPNGLLDPLTPHDLASLLAYLESLKGK